MAESSNILYCKNCSKPLQKNRQYCNKDCRFEHVRSLRPTTNCLRCGQIIQITNKNWLKRGNFRYCSVKCASHKYMIDDNYFLEMTDEKMVTLGQLVGCGMVWDFQTLRIYSDKKTLLDLSRKLNSTYPITKSDRGLYRIELWSEVMCTRLVELGISNWVWRQEMIPYELVVSGMFQTHQYSEVSGLRIFRTESSKLALWVRDYFNGRMTERLEKTNQGFICWWVVVF